MDPDSATGVCLVLVGPDGERTMVPSAGANATLGAAELGRDLLGAADHLHLSGYALLNAGSRAAALFALGPAASVGASVSVDAASAGPIRAVGAQRFLDWIPAGSLLLANADELAALTGADEEAVACAVRTRPPFWWGGTERGAQVRQPRAACWAPRPDPGARPPSRLRCWIPPEPAMPSPPGCWPRCGTARSCPGRWCQANRLGAVAVGKLGARPSVDTLPLSLVY